MTDLTTVEKEPMTIHYQDDRVTLHTGKAVEIAPTLPDQSVDCIVTSPPYFGLRDYGVEGQAGTEATPAEYVAHLTELFRELRRVLTNDGTLWVNLGDSYYSGRGNPGPNGKDPKQSARRGWARQVDKPGQAWGQRKGMLGIPWRVAFALQDDGWILRNDIIWSKPNAMPESVRDRLSLRHEHIFLLTKSTRYWFDLDPIREPHTMRPQRRPSGRPKDTTPRPGAHKQSWPTAERTDPAPDGNPKGKNPGDVWSISTKPFPGAHFATFPPDIPRRAILAGCKPGGTVLDPFSGSATTGMVALEMDRKYIGIDIKADYHDLALSTRLHQTGLL